MRIIMYIEEITQTSFLCPSEWKGRLADGMSVYVRYRFGDLRMGYGPTPDEAIVNSFVVWQSKDRLAGGMKTESMLRLTGLIGSSG